MCKRIFCTFLLLVFLAMPLKAEEIPLSSVSAVVLEAESGDLLFAKDPHTPRPMASTTKLMTALIAAEALPLHTTVTVSSSAVAVEGSSLGLRAGDVLSLGDLLTGLLLSSGNDAANVVAETVAGDIPAFAQLMNDKAKTLGMQDSGFVTPSGLDATGHTASAYDMALLGCAVLKNDFLRQVCSSKTAKIQVNDADVWVSNHNRLLKLSADCIGLKTGFTKKSGRCLVSAAMRDGVTVVVATLNGGDYWNDHLKLYEYAFSKLERVTPTAPSLSPLSVAGGTEGSVALETVSPSPVTVRCGEKVTVSVRIPAFLWAPVRKGETVGTVIYTVGGREIHMPIQAAKAVELRPRTPFFTRLFWSLKETLRMCLI